MERLGSSMRRGSSTSLIGSNEPDSSLVVHTGGATAAAPGNSSSLQKSSSSLVPPQRPFSRTAPEPVSRETSQSSASVPEEHVITEKRRSQHGDGYTYHKYIRGKLLGKGGFAKVYMCTALDVNKNYAVKIVPKANLVKSRARQKFQAEIRIHRTLKHHHICEYKHFFEDKDNCYILLELCHNQSMNEMIKRRKRLTEPEAAFFMRQMVEAVEYMHENCVIHRDLKLGNLFLDKRMHIKVGDLGLATRLENAEEKRKTICGTPNYIAPEVIQGTKETRGHSFEVDIWSMGVILYTILVGKPPYEAKDVKATYQRIIANEYSFPGHVSISTHARELITSMLQSKPDLRPSLEQIREHPFLTDPQVKIPRSLPSSAARTAPVWRENADGELVAYQADETNNSSASQKVLQHRLPRSSSQRNALASRDPNVAPRAYATKSERESRPTENRIPASAAAVKVGSSAGFDIYDETDADLVARAKHATPPQSRPESVAVLTAKAAAIQLEARRLTGEEAEPVAAFRPVSPEADHEYLLEMLERLTAVLEVSDTRRFKYLTSAPKPCSRGGPSKWVTRYVDYTTKYGLGFLLNDGSSGVYFNDSTKAVLHSAGDTFQYIERKRVVSEGTEPEKRNEPVCETHSIDSYPESLQKKVTLLNHFHNYLIEQQKKDGDVPSTEGFFPKGSTFPLVYLKKWVRTKHAILFRLSNQTVQIVFYDQTEVLLTPDERYLTYVDKKGARNTYFLTDDLLGSNAELCKRVKYAKEILNQLIGPGIGPKR